MHAQVLSQQQQAGADERQTDFRFSPAKDATTLKAPVTL